ncbi:MAG: DEAD/DEAH box helicase [Clostridiales bacterium]|jgi:ATP-dependent Lhr-like helicase|nr:DEAD/DEAH box helicase [Clostridiales bacterium]
MELFGQHTQAWFKKVLGEPTPVQAEAWPHIAAGGNVLVCAPTGTGKTLAAFLVFIDRLLAQAGEGKLDDELMVVYVSPLKALAADIRENLSKPLAGIAKEAGDGPAGIRVGLRTGDTPNSERRAMAKKAPHILVTTPESLFLLLASESGQNMLKTAKSIIIDEIHALISSKRGAHLALSVARLDKLAGAPLQKIGLSATIRPLDVAAKFLTMEEVNIVNRMEFKRASIKVASAVGDGWPEIAAAVLERRLGARTAIAFVEGRRQAEMLSQSVNQALGEEFAFAHHGSMSKDRRLEIEKNLREGKLGLVCATSSMELGIDVGEIDRVLQLGCPRTISSVRQRLGRAGHNPGRESVMVMIPKFREEALYCALTAQAALAGLTEAARPPRLCFDILAQHLVAMASLKKCSLEETLSVIQSAYPFRDVTMEDLKSVLEMLAGDYEHKKDVPVRPKVLYDRINGVFEGDSYSRMLALGAGGAIPDKGLFAVKSDGGVKLGELDEEFVFEARLGEKFLLGTFAWRIESISKDAVTVSQASKEGASPPFWRGGGAGRDISAGRAFGEMLGKLQNAYEEGRLLEELEALPFEANDDSIKDAKGFIERQIEAVGCIPTDRIIVVEHFSDSAGDSQAMVHSVFGRAVNAPFSIIVQHIAKKVSGMDINAFDDDDGFMIFGHGEGKIPDGLLRRVKPGEARQLLKAILPRTALYSMAFRYNANRAMALGMRKQGRNPLWIQRLRSEELLDRISEFPNHPLIRETTRECMEDYWDLDGLENVLEGIRTGKIEVREVHSGDPSPMSLPFRRKAESEFMYDYYPVTARVANSAEEEASKLLAPDPGLIAKASERARLPEDEKQLHSLLMTEGDLLALELDIPASWLETLEEAGRALYIEPGLWIAAEHEKDYQAALDGDDDLLQSIARRALRYRGTQTPQTLSQRYFIPESRARLILEELADSGSAVLSDGCYCHADIFGRAQREYLKKRRNEAKTQPAERYQALLSHRLRVQGEPAMQLEAAMKALTGISLSWETWEESIFPLRVNGYNPSLLDSILAGGEYYWQMKDGLLSFSRYGDWQLPENPPLEGDELLAFTELKKRGATFAQALATIIKSPYETLMSLAEKGFAHADSFIPVRKLEGSKKGAPKAKARSRALGSMAGRWELLGSQTLSVEDELEMAFDRSVIVCRETVSIPWKSALAVLRLWELTGRARRGYYVEGLSGSQFVRGEEHDLVTAMLENPTEEPIWLPAQDPAQQWGKSLKHKPGRAFSNVSGCYVCLKRGLPVAVFERRGLALKALDLEYLNEALDCFMRDYKKRRLMSSASRIVVQEFPVEAEDALIQAGFARLGEGFVAYQGYI